MQAMILHNRCFFKISKRHFGRFDFLLYLCTGFQKMHTMQHSNIQIITAAIVALGGLVMLFCGVYIEPQGQLHESLLIGFGEIATFAGALFGIDAAYSKKLWDYINSSDKNPRTQASEEPSSPTTKTVLPAKKSPTKPLRTHSKIPDSSSPPDNTE